MYWEKMDEQTKLDSREPFATVITFKIDTPKCPKCNSIYFVSYGYCDGFDCFNPNCGFHFDGTLSDLDFNYTDRKE
jgi:hypothetical protein